MNEIEQKFYDAFVEWDGNESKNIIEQVPVGIYVADFVIYPNAFLPTIIEIDGHEWHKTKEQRFLDYQKERFFMSMGYLVIRFMGSEVFVDAEKCAESACKLACMFDEKLIDGYEYGLKQGRKEQRDELGLDG